MLVVVRSGDQWIRVDGSYGAADRVRFNLADGENPAYYALAITSKSQGPTVQPQTCSNLLKNLHTPSKRTLLISQDPYIPQAMAYGMWETKYGALTALKNHTLHMQNSVGFC